MTDRFINWYSSHEKWPLLFLLCQIWLTGTPNSVKPLQNGALGNISMGPRLFLVKKPNPPKLANSISGANFVMAHPNEPPWKKLEK